MDKHEYDVYRQGIHDRLQSIYDREQAYANGGVLTVQALEYFIYDMQSVLAEFKAFTDSVRMDPSQPWWTQGGKIDPAWLDPRFYDQYNFWTGPILGGWATLLEQMRASAAVVAPSSPAASPAPGAALQPPAGPVGSTTVNVSSLLPAPPVVYSDGGGGGGDYGAEMPVEAAVGGGGISGAVLIGGLLVGLLAVRGGLK